MPTLYDLIMEIDSSNNEKTEGFTSSDWSALGRGEITDGAVIERMLEEGYENMIED